MVSMFASVGRDLAKKSPDRLGLKGRGAKQREAALCGAWTEASGPSFPVPGEVAREGRRGGLSGEPVGAGGFRENFLRPALG